jgi:CDP-glycerol glycerophosphotransferase (TagB/SpsB family)
MKEAQHFIDYGNYDLSDLYVTGLPKFDKAILNEGADKIVIMPTWRPWEENIALNTPKKTTYYKFLKRIQKAVPEELTEKVIVLPHPCFNTAFRDSRSKSKGLSYDQILRDTKLLITDYSSISYDAFYRGCNVVFFWKELKKCLKNYGENSALMLTEEDAFGDICYTDDELKEAIAKAYYGEQEQRYIDNYRTIVEFHDNKNCDRVIECLKRDKLI